MKGETSSHYKQNKSFQHWKDLKGKETKFPSPFPFFFPSKIVIQMLSKHSINKDHDPNITEESF